MNMHPRQTIAPAVLLFTVLLSGCKPNPPAPGISSSGPQSRQSNPATPPPADAGTITGTVTFPGKPPAAGTIDTGMDPACSLGGAAATLPVEQTVVHGGKLANVFVYVKSGPPAAMQAVASPQPVVMDQQHCRYAPHVVGVVAGGTVEFHNSDPTMHNIHTMPVQAGNDPVDVSQGPRGAPQSKRFVRPELMLPVRCNNHPWMSAFINVSATPFFAVSDDAGNFKIAGLPPGDYVLGAVHEKLGEKTMQLTVQPNATAKADFSFGK